VAACEEPEDEADCGVDEGWRPELVSLGDEALELGVEVALPCEAALEWPGMVAAPMAPKTATAPSAVPAAPIVSPRSRRSAPSRARAVGCALFVMGPTLGPGNWAILRFA
jgi:hypothetical protein